MWQAIGLVSSGITLVAFVVAVAAWAFRQHEIKKERLILTAAEADRAKLVTDALEFFNVDTQNLTKDQQYEIAIAQIKARANRFLIACVVVVIVALLAVAVAAFAIIRHGEYSGMRPRLIIMHASCFYDTTNIIDPDRKFFSFMQYFAQKDVHFLVYSRGFHHGSEGWKTALVHQIPELNSRIHVLEVPTPKTFSDPVLRRQLKTIVKEVLSL